jgi:hypothetical protein
MHDLVSVYTGPEPLAELLRGALEEAGFPAVTRPGGLFPDIPQFILPSDVVVVVRPEDWEQHREEIETLVADVAGSTPIEETAGGDAGES